TATTSSTLPKSDPPAPPQVVKEKDLPRVPETKATTPSPPPPPVVRILPIKKITLEAGETASLEVRIQRENCHGPVRVELVGLPRGVGASPVIVADGDDMARLDLRAQEDAAEGPAAVRLRAGLGTIQQEGPVLVTVRVMPRLRLNAPAQLSLEC